MNRGQVCLEVALNGAWTRRVQPRMPITPDEIIAEGVACAEAGASVVHFHAYDAASGEQTAELAKQGMVWNDISPEERVRMRQRVQPVIDKYTKQVRRGAGEAGVGRHRGGAHGGEVGGARTQPAR